MVDLSKIKKFKVISDGTSAGTKVEYDGQPINTVTKITYVLDALEDVAGKLILEAVIPALELEVEGSDVDIEVASIRECPECFKEIRPDVSYTEPTDGTDPESVVVYECECGCKKVYPFSFDWNSVPQDLEEYQNGDEVKE